MTVVRVGLAGLAMCLVACESLEGTTVNQPARPLVKYSYIGPNFTAFTGTLPSWGYRPDV